MTDAQTLALDAAIHLINSLRSSDRDPLILKFAEQDFDAAIEQLRSTAPQALAATPDAVKLLNDILDASQDFRRGMPSDWEGDPLQDAIDEARAFVVGGALAATPAVGGEADVQIAKAMYDWQYGAGAWDSSQSSVREHFIGLARAALPASPLRGMDIIELCAKVAEEFTWTLPLYAPTEDINVATGEAANIVIRQIAEAIRSASPPEQPARYYDRRPGAASDHEQDRMAAVRGDPPLTEAPEQPAADLVTAQDQAQIIKPKSEKVFHELWRSSERELCGLEARILEYANDLRRNSSGGDDYPWEYAKATADYLETLLTTSRASPPDLSSRSEAKAEQPAADPVTGRGDLGIVLSALRELESAVGESYDDEDGVVAQIERDYHAALSGTVRRRD